MNLFSSFLFLFLLNRCHCGESDIPPPGTVKIHPPSDLTVVETGETYAFIFWYPPQNYQSHSKDDPPPKTIDPNNLCPNLTSMTNVKQSLESAYNLFKSKKNLPNATEAGMIGSIHIPNILVNKTLSSTSQTDNKSGNMDKENKTSSMDILHSYLGKDIIPIGCDVVHGYIVSWRPNGTVPWTRKIVRPNVTEYNITGLLPNIVYQLNVSAFYVTNANLSTETFHFMTVNDSKSTGCLCSKFNLTRLGCDTTKVPCGCKEGYTGAYCEICAEGYYNLKPGLPCYRCPCDLKRSSGTCKMAEGYLYCDHCKDGHSGNLCSDCAFGYHRYNEMCLPCSCNNNSDMCDKYSGQCLVCRHNTTGFSCERCKHDYVGDAIRYKNCTHKHDLGPQMMPAGMIAGICIAVILVLSAIVGCIVYRKWKNFPTSRPFWTVELKDDHEGVNFSNIPEDEFTHREMEDLEFYKDQGGHINKKGVQKYAPLHEST